MRASIVVVFLSASALAPVSPAGANERLARRLVTRTARALWPAAPAAQIDAVTDVLVRYPVDADGDPAVELGTLVEHVARHIEAATDSTLERRAAECAGALLRAARVAGDQTASHDDRAARSSLVLSLNSATAAALFGGNMAYLVATTTHPSVALVLACPLTLSYSVAALFVSTIYSAALDTRYARVVPTLPGTGAWARRDWAKIDVTFFETKLAARLRRLPAWAEQHGSAERARPEDVVNLLERTFSRTALDAACDEILDVVHEASVDETPVARGDRT